MKDHGVTSVEQVHQDGKLRPEEWWRARGLAVQYWGIQRWLTAFDDRTLRHEILDELGLHHVRPEFKSLVINKKGEIECHLDGSFIENAKAGGYAVYLGHNTGTEMQQGGYARNAYSSLEPELRAIKTAIRVLPLGTNILCTIDSESSIK